jgi:outer membrane protein assembly factor BamA
MLLQSKVILQAAVYKKSAGISCRQRFTPFMFLLLLIAGSGFIYGMSPVGDTLHIKPIRVDSIEIRGNAMTDPDVIYRELTFKKGDTVSVDLLQYNRERIYSLGIFNQVSVSQKPEKEGVILIDVHESWYIWPIPFIEMNDHDWNKLTYGIDLSIANFRGENQKIHIKSGFGYNPYLTVSYENPGLDSSGKFYFGFSASFGKLKNKSDSAKALFGGDFFSKYYDFSFSLGERFNKNEWLFWSLGYQKYSYPDSPINPTFSKLSPGSYPYTSLEYRFDTRDLSQNASQGVYYDISETYKGFGSRGISYQTLRLDLANYFPLGNTLVLKLRGIARQVSGSDISYFDLMYIGYDQRIRGQYSYHQEGKGLYFGSAELKLPIVQELDIDFHFPIIPERLQQFRTGLFGYLFTDAGSIHTDAFSLKGQSSGFGFGAGLGILILPYNILRIEAAFDKHFKRELLLDFGTPF